MRAPFDTENLESSANTLVYRVWGNAQLAGDLLRGEVLIDEAQAIKLPFTKPVDPLLNVISWRLSSHQCFRHHPI